eukprot:1141114-Pelagomonas_calceolata.AAC.2
MPHKKYQTGSAQAEGFSLLRSGDSLAILASQACRTCTQACYTLQSGSSSLHSGPSYLHLKLVIFALRLVTICTQVVAYNHPCCQRPVNGQQPGSLAKCL